MVTSFGQSLKGNKPHSSVFVGQVGPNDVIEDMRFDRVDGKRQRGKTLGFRRIVKGGSVDNESGEMIEMWMGDEVRCDVLTNDVHSICTC